MIFLAVLNGQPKELGLDQAIHCFINHRIDVCSGAPCSCCARRASASTSWKATR